MNFATALHKLLHPYYIHNASTRPIKIIVICDPGVDDLLMLIQILSAQFYEVVAILPVQGNTTCFNAVQNTLSLCELLSKTNVQIYSGSGYDKLAPPQAEETAVYGENGLNSLKLPVAKQMKMMLPLGIEFACDALIKDQYLLVSTAALTEPAKIFIYLEQNYPAALKNILAISMMGGVINHTQEANWPIQGQRYSEANFACDIVASKITFDICEKYQIPILLSPLDLTHSVLASNNDIAKIKTISNCASDLVVKLIENVPAHYQRRYQKGPDQQFRQPLHDVHASSCLMHPELYHGHWMRIRMDTKIEPQQIKITDDTQGNIYLLDMHYTNRDKFFTYLADDLSHYNYLSSHNENAVHA